MKDIKIGNKIIGRNHKTFIIAEIAVNHLGNVDLAKSMVDSAKRCGADAVKFQHHLPDEEMVKEKLPKIEMYGTIGLYDIICKNNLTIEEHKELNEYCDSKNIIYLCTPFSLKAAMQINPLVPAFKIGSGEFTDLPTLIEIAKIGKPMILSTGMSTMDEIDMVFNKLYSINQNIILMNCTSEYPPAYEDINLPFITELIDRYPIIIGQSDHTPTIYTSLVAVALGARIIEKHFILDKNIPGPDSMVSLNPEQFKDLVDGIRIIEKSMKYVQKNVYSKEKVTREWARRSIVSIKDIKKGEKLTLENIWSKRPGNGIPSYRMDEILNKRVKRNIPHNSLLDWEDIE